MKGLLQGAVQVTLSSKQKHQDELVRETEEDAKRNEAGEPTKKQKKLAKKSEYDMQPDGKQTVENEEEDIVKGLCSHAKFVLKKPESSYPFGQEGKKEMVKNARDALREQMAFEGRSKVSSSCTALITRSGRTATERNN